MGDCKQTNIPEVDNTEMECIEFTSSNCTIYPDNNLLYLGIQQGTNISEVLLKIVNRLQQQQITINTQQNTIDAILSNTYSETETIVGDYLGAPLYRAVALFDPLDDVPLGNSGNIVITHNFDVNKYTRLDFIFPDLNGGEPTVYSASDLISQGIASGVVNVTDNTIEITPFENTYGSVEIQVVVEYIKN